MVYLSCGKNRLHTIPAAKLQLILHICKIFVYFFIYCVFLLFFAKIIVVYLKYLLYLCTRLDIYSMD